MATLTVDREKLLTALEVAATGAAVPPKPATVDQSDCFLFLGDRLVTFSDDLAVRMPNPVPGLECVVGAAELLKVVRKLPDREVSLELAGTELVVRGGKRREAGIVVQADVKLPHDQIPAHGEWHPVREGVAGLLKQAAATCGRDDDNPMTTIVHVTPNLVEACDNWRLIRGKLKTGFPKKVLIPAASMGPLEALALRKVSVTKGWAHFLCPGKAVVSVKLVMDDFVDLTDALAMRDPVDVRLPENLAEIVSRSEVMSEGKEPLVGVVVRAGAIEVKTSRDSGWYKETKKIKYAGRTLRFHVNPKYFSEALHRSTKVQVSDGKMKLAAEGIEFIVILEVDEAPAKKVKKGNGKKKVKASA